MIISIHWKYLGVIFLIQLTFGKELLDSQNGVRTLNLTEENTGLLEDSTTCPSDQRRAQMPQNLPDGITLFYSDFLNWGGSIEADGLLATAPSSTSKIVALANWASQEGYKLRANGKMHSWAPLTLSYEMEISASKPYPHPTTLFADNSKVILVKTNNLSRMKILPNYHRSFPAARVQCGATLEKFLAFLLKFGYAIGSHPAVGKISICGLMAICGHGTGIPTKKDRKASKTKDLYSSVCNIIVAYRAIVWNEKSNMYELKTFRKGKDEDFPGMLCGLGGTFITDVTFKVSKSKNVQCLSFLDIPDYELFAKPKKGQSLTSLKKRTFSSFLDKCGRIETILFPFTDKPWTKVWCIRPKKPKFSRKVTAPYNYPFSDFLPKEVSDIYVNISLGASFLAPIVGQAQYDLVVAGLAATASYDIWGASKNVLLYIKPTTLRLGDYTTTITTQCSNVQQVLYESYKKYNSLLYEFASKQKFPINGPCEVRVSKTDLGNEEAAGISGAAPYSKNKTFDCVIWFSVLTAERTPESNEFLTALEQWFFDRYDGGDGIAGPEWSKEWGYTNKGPFTNGPILKTRLPERFGNFEMVKKVMKKYDPYSVFSNSFLKFLFK